MIFVNAAKWSHQALTRQMQIISAFDQDLTTAQTTSSQSFNMSFFDSFDIAWFFWYGALCRDSCSKLHDLQTQVTAAASKHTQLRYATSLHWAITQFTPASMHIQPQNLTAARRPRLANFLLFCFSFTCNYFDWGFGLSWTCPPCSPQERLFALGVVVFALVGFSYAAWTLVWLWLLSLWFVLTVVVWICFGVHFVCLNLPQCRLSASNQTNFGFNLPISANLVIVHGRAGLVPRLWVASRVLWHNCEAGCFLSLVACISENSVLRHRFAIHIFHITSAFGWNRYDWKSCSAILGTQTPSAKKQSLHHFVSPHSEICWARFRKPLSGK